MANHCDTIKLEKGMYQEAGPPSSIRGPAWRGWTPFSGS